MPPHIHERQLEQWANLAISMYLSQRGYLTAFFPPSQRLEHHLPADAIFGVDGEDYVKLIGLQYKALYTNGSDHWLFDSHQHVNLRRYSWIHYALSDLDDPNGVPNILHHLRFTQADAVSVPRTEKSGLRGYVRWATFMEQLLSCRRGIRVRGPEDFPPVVMLPPEVETSNEMQNLIQVLLINHTRRTAAMTFGALVE